MRLVEEADACLAAGHPERAIASLDGLLVWEAAEVQSAARLARAMLDAREGGGPDGWLRKTFALARFCALHGDRSTARSEMLLRARWSTERLDALAHEAEAWLASDGRA